MSYKKNRPRSHIYKNVSETDKQNYSLYSRDFGISEAVLIEYASENNLKFKDFEKIIEEAKESLVNDSIQDGQESMTVLSDDEETILPEIQVGAPYSFDRNQNEAVNLNMGSLTYEVIDEVIPGRNGLDLTIGRRYDSEKANVYNPVGKISRRYTYDYYVDFTWEAYFYRPGIGEGR